MRNKYELKNGAIELTGIIGVVFFKAAPTGIYKAKIKIYYESNCIEVEMESDEEAEKTAAAILKMISF